MKKISILLLMFFITSCSLLDVESSDVTNNYTTVGQELIDLKKAYQGIKISSGNSFVHETETQLILNGSYDVGFTMDLVCKDVQLFNKLTINLIFIQILVLF